MKTLSDKLAELPEDRQRAVADRADELIADALKAKAQDIHESIIEKGVTITSSMNWIKSE